MKNNYRNERKRKYDVKRTEESWAAFCQEIYENNFNVIMARANEEQKHDYSYEYECEDLVA